MEVADRGCLSARHGIMKRDHETAGLNSSRAEPATIPSSSGVSWPARTPPAARPEADRYAWTCIVSSRPRMRGTHGRAPRSRGCRVVDAQGHYQRSLCRYHPHNRILGGRGRSNAPRLPALPGDPDLPGLQVQVAAGGSSGSSASGCPVAVNTAMIAAVPAMFPVHPIQILPPGHVDKRDFLLAPVRLPTAVEAHEPHPVAADLAHQRRRQPLRWEVGTLVADDPGQGAQILFAAVTGAVIRSPSPRVLLSRRSGYAQNVVWRRWRGPAHTGT